MLWSYDPPVGRDVRVVVAMRRKNWLGWVALTALPVLPVVSTVPAALAQSTVVPAQSQPASGVLVLKARRLPDSVEVLIEGTGPAPLLQQSSSGGLWFGQLATSQPLRLSGGTQRIALQEGGIESITLQGSGNSYQIQIKPMGGAPVPRPVISADGRNLILSFSAAPQATTVTGRFDLNAPGRVPQSAFAPPLQPRAVAPPLGDMAVGSMVLRNRSFVNLSGPRVTLTLRNAPAKDALMALAQMGNYGFVYVDDIPAGAGAAAAPTPASSRSVSISFRNEAYARAVNAVLLAGSLQGKLEGSMLVAGPNVFGKSFGSQISKVYRLNQASAFSAANYLASLGASINKVTSVTTAVSSGLDQTAQVSGAASTQQTTSSTQQTVESYGASSGPLRGLQGTTDSRLSTITLVGDPTVVAIAESYLRQLDLRQRQVALSVKILDVTLDNDAVFNNSFAFRYGNNFIVNDQGRLLGAFGQYLPPGKGVFTDTPFQENVTSTQSANSSTGRNILTTDIASNALSDNQVNTLNSTLAQSGVTLDRVFVPQLGREGFAVVPINTSAATTAFAGTDTISRILSSTLGRNVNLTEASGSSSTSDSTFAGRRNVNPGQLYPANNFYNFVQASITAQSTKVLASPTLILSENQDELKGGVEAVASLQTAGGSSSGGSSSSGSSGGSSGSSIGAATIGRPRANESFVTVGEQLITSFTVSAATTLSSTACQPQFGIAGLTFGARVSKIDDNGFVTFSLSPQVSAATGTQDIPGCGKISILSVRRLDTGSSRVRDGQTLILTGVISDADAQTVTKWPILGDIPLIGQFFRSSGGSRKKRELVILVTPRIINDTEGGVYGYGYEPSTKDTRNFLGNGGN